MTCEKQLHGLLIGDKTVFILKTAVEPKSWQGRAPITGVDTTVGASETRVYLQPAGRTEVRAHAALRFRHLLSAQSSRLVLKLTCPFSPPVCC